MKTYRIDFNICHSIIILAVDISIVRLEFLANKAFGGLDPCLLPFTCAEIIKLVVGVEH